MAGKTNVRSPAGCRNLDDRGVLWTLSVGKRNDSELPYKNERDPKEEGERACL